jgi:hypothetical protein
MKQIPHEYGPSRVGHGEAQCIHCLGTNRENAIIAPNHCEYRAAKLNTPKGPPTGFEAGDDAARQRRCDAPVD